MSHDPGMWFNRLNGGEFIGLVAVAGGLVIAVIAIIASYWRSVRVAEIEGSLKQQMLDKGMTAADIEKVLNAGSNRTAGLNGN